MRVSFAALYAALSALGPLACQDINAPATGAIRVEALTTGLDFDPDGFRITVDADSVGRVQSNGSIIISGLRPGPRAVRLTELALNCALAPSLSPSLTVTVVASDTVDATFDIQCSANVGAIFVLPLAGGFDLDTDGYLVSLDGGVPIELGTQGITLQGIAVGSHSLTLSGMASNCSASPATITTLVHFNQSAMARHSVSCILRTGLLRVVTTTTGEDGDTDGYAVQLENLDDTAVPSNGSTTLGGVREGPRLVTLSGLSPNCTVVGSNPRPVTISFGLTTDLNFEVSCTAAAKVRVTLATTGIDADLAYRVRVEGTNFDRRDDVSANGDITIMGMGAGTHTVTLEDMAVNCDVSAGSNPRTVAVTSGNTTDVDFAVACAPATQIAFVRWLDPSWEIFVGRTSGVPVTQLTANNFEEHDPAYSPDGSRIAFRSNRDGNHEIYVMNADGSGPVRLTNNPADDLNPEWSPDGAKIAFRSNRDGNDEIYVMNADGSNVTRLTNHVAFDANPSWSPDGTRIAFMSDRSGNSQIHVMNVDGSNVVRLTNTAGWDGLPAWSPDGVKIAFAREVECDDYYYYCHNIVVMNADGTGAVRFETRSHDTEPVWSPDGKWIAFETRYCDYYYCSAFSISAIKPDGKGRTEVVSGELYNPAWRKP